jgi:hypothetical protein
MSPRPLSYGIVKPRVLERLRQADGGHVSTKQLIEHVWTMHDLDGPENAENAIAKALQQLRRHGHSIQSKRGPNNPGHRLILSGES